MNESIQTRSCQNHPYLKSSDPSLADSPLRATWWGICAAGIACSLLGLALVHPFAGSWNDGSRLACIESLGERDTWILDGSLFVYPNGKTDGSLNPYDPASELLAKRGTLDLMQIKGHFYSDKSPVPSLLLAGIWKAGRFLGFPEAAQNPGFFCWFIGILGGAVPFALGAAALFSLSARLAYSPAGFWWLFVAGVFVCTAPCYTWGINTHIQMWGITAICFAVIDGVSRRDFPSHPVLFWFLGNLLGLSYTVDAGVGPALVLAAGGWGLLNWSRLGWAGALTCLLGLIPWIGLHHYLGFMIAGTWGPMNANPDFFLWPGSPFNPSNLTGGWKHPGIGKFLLYCGDMLFGKKGILFHQGVGLLGFLALMALVKLPRTPFGERSVLWMARLYFLVGFLVYAVGSNNQSGLCCSVRWFVPLAIPLWYAASLAYSQGGKVAIAWPWMVGVGTVVCGFAAWFGPWYGLVLPGYWVVAVTQVVLALWVIFPSRNGAKQPAKS